MSKYTQYLFFLSVVLFACQPKLPDDIQLVYQDLPEKIDFNFHIRPILADRCYSCHGPDDNTREAGLRLDIEKEAFARLKESGDYAFVKGNIHKSKAWQRIISKDPERQMPPPESNLYLSDKEKALITKWIEKGAEWREHWAFTQPKKPEIPDNFEGWMQNPIDYFIGEKLIEKGLSPSPIANKERLIRRVTMDLTGLPPTLSEIDGFLKDKNQNAYENLVDRLLSTDEYAERMAMDWLDIARFGDTQGLHLDAERYNWPWRDWVIKAFKENMAYDDFITWQIAGDLLPNATREQKLATAFLRNHTTSSEGGVPDEEFRQKYVQDRTNTTATAFLGLTMECAACHDHKFDPVSQKEYYQMSAFFNNIKELGMINEFRVKDKAYVNASGPVLLLPSAETEEQLNEIAEKIAVISTQKKEAKTEISRTAAYIENLKNRAVLPPKPDATFPFENIKPHKVKDGVIHRIQNKSPINQMVDNNPASLACGHPEIVPGKMGNALRFPKEMDLVFSKKAGTFELNEPYSAGAWIYTEKAGENQTIMGTSGELGNAWRGWDLFLDTLDRPTIRLTSMMPHNYMQIRATKNIEKERWQQIYFTYDGSGITDGLKLYVNGQQVESFVEYDNLYNTILHDWSWRKEWLERPIMVARSGRYYSGESGVFKGSIDQINVFNKYLSPLDIAALYVKEAGIDFDQIPISADKYVDHYLHHQHRDYRKLDKELQKLLSERTELIASVPEIMVMEEHSPQRKTFILNRGQYDQPTEEVQPGTPQKVLAFSESLPKNRIGLAQWLTDKKNPLTARVAVNRYWQMIFGKGIVNTPHDFGTQGALPSHPELMDWLAVTFQESGWDIKALIKQMVLSYTYRQSSVITKERQEKDPGNIYLARAPSYRLPAEMIRDNALAASGLLHKKTGGPSVKPYQPDGIWDFGGLVSGKYQAATGKDLYRRSMYTYIRRTSPHPAMIAFDVPDRTVCTAKRENTNTPLQALVLLNDPQFVEAAKVLAERMYLEGGNHLQSQIQYGFQLLCGRKPKVREVDILNQQYQIALNKYEKTPKEATQLLQVGETVLYKNVDQGQIAALTIVANTLINFDEAYMKR